MVAFFRKIRQSLLGQNKVTRYLVYAMGEIALVMIGILLALQVNNWNETKKNRDFEKEILGLIDQNLMKDSILITAELSDARMGNTLTDSLLKQINLRNYDERLNDWMGKIITFQRFKSQSSAFEVLKSKGIDNISNKELQLVLMEYYDQTLFKVYQANEDVQHFFEYDWVPVAKAQFSSFIYLEKIEPRNPKEFFDDPSTPVLFKMYQDNRSGSIRRMEKALEDISTLRVLIKQQSS
ncbi:DUF6090 family protein [Algoriphagus namhaensis]